jgi:uncharacterized phage protein (TIGR01671 family)
MWPRFRIWDTVNKEMHYPKSVEISDKGIVKGFSNSDWQCHPMDDRLVPMMFTGVVDVNGVDIFDGDIVLLHERLFNENTPTITAVGKIKYEYNKAGFYIYFTPGSTDINMPSCLVHNLQMYEILKKNCKLEVIGNCFNNPHPVGDKKITGELDDNPRQRLKEKFEVLESKMNQLLEKIKSLTKEDKL